MVRFISVIRSGFLVAVLSTLLLTDVAGAQMRVIKPSGNLGVKVGHPSTVSLYDVPVSWTNERINKHGWKAESVEFARTALNSQALAQGTIQLAISQTLDPLRVIHKGAKIVWLLENNRGEFIIIARKDIKNCKQIDGKRFGIHGETSPVSLASVAWVRECGAKPKVLVLPGGENRIVALQNNQLDATVVQLADWLNLDAMAPGKFHTLDAGGVFNISVL